MMKFIVIYIIVGVLYGILNLINERDNIKPLLSEIDNRYLIIIVLSYTIGSIIIGPIMMTLCIILGIISLIVDIITKKL